ncbi:MAG: virulence RhuM family protein [Methanomassiliicoccaceae archaeon]|nr:virulence RhuM family protein [Methanomassiliicoccaceae archaeon]
MTNVFEEEFNTPATVARFATVRTEGELEEMGVVNKFGISELSNRRPTQYYNLNAIAAVGHRVRSQTGTSFREWASEATEKYGKSTFS